MKIIQLKESEKIKEGLRSLTEEFIGEYPYYSTWIQKNETTFKDGTRVVYELNDNENVVGYMMVHFSTEKCAKINGIFVFPDFQKRGYAKKALLQVLEQLKITTMHLFKPVLITRLWFICLNHYILMLSVKITTRLKNSQIG